MIMQKLIKLHTSNGVYWKTVFTILKKFIHLPHFPGAVPYVLLTR